MKHLLATLAICLLPSLTFGQADSVADFSDAQGPTWFNGLYNQTSDADGVYAASDFQAFGDGNTYVWNGSNWDEENADGDNVPWTTMAADTGHPNGDNNGEVHYAIRRWVAGSGGSVDVDYNLAKQNANCGNGTTALLFHNGSEVASSTVAFNDAVGVTDSVSLSVAAGDTVDLALSPLGTDGTLNDGCDGSVFGMSITQAAPVGLGSISINFGADEPDGAGSQVSGAAGVLGNSNWNNLEGANGSASGLVDGNGAATAASVDWVSNNTWASTGRSEENNTAPDGNDKNLMTGYLDTAGASGQGVELTVNGLADAVGASSYDVYVYAQGGVVGRGGDYVLGDETQSNNGAAPFDGNFVSGPDGNYMVFSGVSGDSFTLTSVPTIGNPARAPINGIEIVGVPEPTGISMILFGVLLPLVLRKRK